MDIPTLALAKAYTDSTRLAYSEGGNVILPETVVPDGGMVSVGALNLVDGREYVVTLTAQGANREFVLTAASEDGYIFLSGDGTPFEIGNDLTSNIWYIDISVGTETAISVKETETIHPIDPKYLPGAVLPVVELTTALANNTTLTDAENALLNEAFESNSPIVLKGSIDFGVGVLYTGRTIASQLVVEQSRIFMAMAGATVIQLQSDDGATWSVVVEA